VTVTNSAGAVALAATGNGGAAGITSVGGASDGTGIIATGGATNGNGLSATGAGVGTGVIATGGATGEGLYCTGNGGAAALHVGAGHAIFTGTQPAVAADPGQDNLLCATNLPKAWAMLSTNGSGGVTVNDGFNIASAAVVSTTHVLVTFARAFANPSYAVMLQNCTKDEDEIPRPDFGSQTTTTVKIYWVDSTNSPLNPSTTEFRTSILVFGRQ
jgi:hypothetical protein